MTKAPAVISPHNATTECTTAREQPPLTAAEKDRAQQQRPSAAKNESVNYWEGGGLGAGPPSFTLFLLQCPC